MSLSGRLEDVPLVDVLQFVKLAGRSGRLELSSGDDRVEIGIYQGQIASTNSPSTKRLGELLVDQGVIDESTLLEALARQTDLPEARPIGGILEEMGAIEHHHIVEAFGAQVREVIFEVAAWHTGRFSFVLERFEPRDDIKLSPSDVAVVELHTQHVMLEAARLLAERHSWEADAPGAPPAPTRPGPAVKTEPAMDAMEAATTPAPRRHANDQPLRLQVVSHDRSLSRDLAACFPHRDAFVASVSPQGAATREVSTPVTAVLVDLRAPGVTLAAVEAVRAARPNASILALPDEGLAWRDVYQAGATAVVDSDVTTIAACLDRLEPGRRSGSHEGLFDQGLRTGFARLRRVIREIRTGVAAANSSLDQLNAISDSVNRAVFMLARPKGLTVFGAFGRRRDGQQLADTTQGLRLDAPIGGVLRECLASGQAKVVDWTKCELPTELSTRVGKPRAGRGGVCPVRGNDRVVAVVYADNGDEDWPVEEIELLELVVAQVGMAVENQELRRSQLGDG